MARGPFFVAGTGRFDTQVTQHFGQRVFCRVGAEGVHCAALPELGLGVAIKVDDGNTSRAFEAVQAALMRRLLRRCDADEALLGALCDVVMRNWNGIEVGRLQAQLPG